MRKINYKNIIQYFIFFLIIILFVFYIRYYYVTIENYSPFVMTPKKGEEINISITSNQIKDTNNNLINNPILVKIFQLDYNNNKISENFIYEKTDISNNTKIDISDIFTGNIGFVIYIYGYDTVKSEIIDKNLDIDLDIGNYVLLSGDDLDDTSYINAEDREDNITVTPPVPDSTTYNFKTKTEVEYIKIALGIPCRD